MSKVNSFKCDICGEIYHVTEGVTNEFITIHKHCVSADEGEATSYKHICPTCEGTLRTFLDDPTLFDEQEEALHTAKTFNSKLKSMIRNLYVDVLRIIPCFHELDSVSDFEAIIDRIKEEHEDKKQLIRDLREDASEQSERINNQLWAIRILAGLLGACIGAALAQILM